MITVSKRLKLKRGVLSWLVSTQIEKGNPHKPLARKIIWFFKSVLTKENLLVKKAGFGNVGGKLEYGVFSDKLRI